MTNHSISEAQVFALCQSQSQFPIDFDEAWQWLGYFNKPTAKRALLSCGFEEEIDLRIDAALSTASNPRPEECITITVDCFKMWAMMAGTEKGRDARLYFLRCEKQLRQIDQISAAKTKSLFDLSDSQLGRLAAHQISIERGGSPNKHLIRDIDLAFLQASSGAVIYAQRFALVTTTEDLKLEHETLKEAGWGEYESDEIARYQVMIDNAKDVIASIENEYFWLSYKADFDEFETSQLVLVGEAAGLSRNAVAQKALQFQQESINSARGMISKSRSRKTKT